MAQNAPTLASSRRSNDEGPQYMRAEAIAMRRLVAERGWWLSPQFATVPLPVLTEWEASVELAKVDHNHTTRERQQAKNLLKNRSQYQSHKRSQQSTAENVLATIDTAPRHKGDRHRNYATPSVLDVTIGRTKTPATIDTLQARKAHRDTIEEVAQAQGKSPAEVERELALARITALAAEKAAADAAAAAAHPLYQHSAISSVKASPPLRGPGAPRAAALVLESFSSCCSFRPSFVAPSRS